MINNFTDTTITTQYQHWTDRQKCHINIARDTERRKKEA